MEFYGKPMLPSFIHEEERSLPSPTQSSLKPNHQDMETGPQSTPSLTPLFPPRPESPWTLSPLHLSPSPSPSPSPSLLYHCIASLHRYDGNVFSIALSKGLIFTGSDSNRIRVWRQPDCIDRGFLKSNSGVVRVILAHGDMLFTAHKDLKIRVWNVYSSINHKSKKVCTLPTRKGSSFLSFTAPQKRTQHQDVISCLAYYHAEGLLYTGSYDKTIKSWRLADKKCVDNFMAHDDVVTAILVNQNDGSLFTASSDSSVKIWRRIYGDNSHTLTMTLKFQNSPVNALALSCSSGPCYLYSGSSDGVISFWEKEAVSERFNHGGFLQGHQFAVLCLAAIERLVFSGSEDTTIRVWRREEGSGFHSCLAVMEGHRGPVRCLAACLEMQKVIIEFLVYSSSFDRTVKAWRVKIFPGEKTTASLEDGEKSYMKKSLEDGENSYMKKKMMMEYEMSPVLSPTWVEKKLQANHY